MTIDATVWLVLMGVFLVVEAACPIHLVSVWFSVGSLAAAIVGAFSGPVWLQILVFLVISGGLLAALWPFTKRFLNPKLTATNVDSVLGTQGYVTDDIDNLDGHGQVKLGGMYWTARSADGSAIPAGTRVRVEKIEGVKVIVTPVTEEATVS